MAGCPTTVVATQCLVRHVSESLDTRGLARSGLIQQVWVGSHPEFPWCMPGL